MLKAEFYITEAAPLEADRLRVVEMAIQSQAATDVPNPDIFPPDTLEDHIYNGRDNLHLLAIHGKTRQVIGHVAIEEPNKDHIEGWDSGIKQRKHGPMPPLLEIGGLFVDPNFWFRGIGLALSSEALDVIRQTSAKNVVPVAATWAETPNAKKIASTLGGREILTKEAIGGPVTLWAFNKKRKRRG